MLIYTEGSATPVNKLPKDGTLPAIVLIPIGDLEQDAKALGMTHILPPPLDESAANRFERHPTYECMLLNIPDKSEDVEAPPINIDIYYTPNRLFMVHDPCPAIEGLKARLENPKAPLAFSQALYTFFNLLTEKDASYLESIEADIAALEDAIVEEEGSNYTREISTLRKKLLKQKRYFESLIDALEEMEKNEGGLLTPQQLAAFHIITNRADRQFRAVLNLRDYVTQVREAYQAQIDINLNKTMKFFTVITAIFLPLTLIVGWYGMNLQMPEIGSPYAYPVVIGLSAAIVLGMVIYFRKNKWF